MSADDHETRHQRAMLSLDGLSVGDAFGERFFGAGEFATASRIANQDAPLPPWTYTDDTEMATCIVHLLKHRGRIEQDELADLFATRYAEDPSRGYGGTAHRILREIGAGQPWKSVSASAFDGMGSLGNGGAMRAAPLGAYFADDLTLLIEQARMSAEVTHAHPEGQAGAIAIAVAAAYAWNHRGQYTPRVVGEFMDFVLEHTPDSATRAGIAQAIDLPRSYSIETAVSVLGNGTGVSAPDTVPFCIWSAARHFNRYDKAMWMTVTGGGDRDTTCAIVGGIVVLSDPQNGIPGPWLKAREPLRFPANPID